MLQLTFVALCVRSYLRTFDLDVRKMPRPLPCRSGSNERKSVRACNPLDMDGPEEMANPLDPEIALIVAANGFGGPCGTGSGKEGGINRTGASDTDTGCEGSRFPSSTSISLYMRKDTERREEELLWLKPQE